MTHKMKQLLPLFLAGVVAASMSFSGWQLANSAPPAAPATQSTQHVAATETKTPKADAVPANAMQVDPMVLLKNPDQFLNKTVMFEGTFNRFSDVGLDYKKAFRDSKDYVTFFILRPDVAGHNIPMSELKLFYPRKKSEEVMELESGDRIRVVGTQFSTALGEPWLDVNSITIIRKTASSEKREESPDL